MLNVAMLTPFFTGELGGPYNVILELALQLENMGVNTNVFTTSSINKFGKEKTVFFEKKSRNFSIYRFNSYIRFKEYRISFNMLPYLLKNAKNIDIIHSHALRSFQEDIGSLISLIRKKPLLISPHGGISINWDYSDKIPKMIYDISIGYLKRKLLNLHFIAVARSEIPIIKKYGISENNIHFIPHGVNTEIFKPIDSTDLKKKYNLENSDVILYVGRIAKGKGVDKLIKILNLIVKKNENVKLVIVGGDAGYLPRIKQLIQYYNLLKNVVFSGFILKEDLAKYYSMADLVVYPSRQEIFGMVITEAAACGKAAIGSDILGPSEIIVNKKTGYTSNFEDLNEVSEIILDLLNNKPKLKKMGENALIRVKQKYTWNKTAEAHLKVYKNIIK